MYKNPKLNKAVSKAPTPLSPKAKQNLKDYGTPVSSEDEDFSLSDLASSNEEESGSEEETIESISYSEEETSSEEEGEPDEELLEKLDDFLSNVKIVNESTKKKEVSESSKDLEPLLLIQEDKESDSTFLMRKDLTNKIAMLQDPKINWITAMVVASMFMNKVNLNVTYSDEIEEALSVILNQLEKYA